MAQLRRSRPRGRAVYLDAVTHHPGAHDMSSLRLVLRNLFYFRAANLAVVAGVAVATAVLTGALMVGDSVRGSLRELAVRRLGPVDHALVATRFFPESLVDRLRADPDVARRWDLSPALMVRGGASNDGRTVRAAGVQVIGLGPAGNDRPWVDAPDGRCVVNAQLAEALGVTQSGQGLLFALPAAGNMPREATLASRSFQDVLTTMSVDVADVAREPGMRSSFSFDGSQRAPRNAWVALRDLQRAIDQPARVNAVLAHARDDTGKAPAD